MPIKKLEAFFDPLEIAEKSWRLTYLYFWSYSCALVLSLIVFLFLIRRPKVDLFDFVSVITRCLALGAGTASLAMIGNRENLYNLFNLVLILPLAVAYLSVVLCCDKLASVWCNRQLYKSGQPYAIEHGD